MKSRRTTALTEEQQGGTTPQAEADAPVQTASEETVAAVAVADEPASTAPEATTDGTEESTDHTAEAAVVTDPAGDVTTDQMDGADPAGQVPPVVEAPEESTGSATTATAEVAAEAPAEAEAQAEAQAQAEATTEPASTEAQAQAEPAQAEAQAEPAQAEPAQAEATAEPAQAEATAESGTESAPEAQAEAEPAPTEPVAPPKPTGPEPTTMEELLAEQDADIRSFKHGDVVEGKVVRIDKDEILVDIGAKSEGVVSNRELYGRNAESQPVLTIGDTVLVYVLQPESPEGHAVLSLRRAGLERKWRAMQEQFEAGVIIEAPVIDHNKGGLIVDCGIRGFVPISQIVDFPRRPQNDQPRDAAQEIAEKLQPYVGRKLRLKILEVNRKANRLILSEKVALYEERREKRDELFSSLQVGQRVKGTVRSIAPFGVFIDLGGIDGLVHKSELSWNKVNNPEAGYKVGDEVEAEVIDINHERGRISLSIRRLQPDPWHSTVADFKVGDIIDGTVTKLVNFGAFVRVRDGLEGLIHISELSHQRVAHPGDVVHEGQQLKLKIISLDSERHRLGLSLKQAEEPPVRAMPEPGAPRPERRERRERERGYSMSDAVQEPEGGIDNTLAAAFAQVRQQLAEAEAAEGDSDTAAVAEAVAEEAAAEAAVADEVAAEAVTEAVSDEVIAEEAAAEAAVADEVAAEAVTEAVVEAVIAEEREAEAEVAVEAAEAGDIAPEVAEDAVVEAVIAEAVAEEAAEEAVASVEVAEAVEEIAEEAAEEAAVAEAVAEDAVVEADVAEAEAEGSAAEAAEAEAEETKG
jgi:small subunit ribosomal protein S1